MKTLILEQSANVINIDAVRCFTKDLLDNVGKGFVLSIKKNEKWKLSNFDVDQGPEMGAAVFRKYYDAV